MVRRPRQRLVCGQGWLLGANYVTSNAVNQIEMFQAGTYDPRRIDAELRLAQQIGFNTVRVFLHDQLWATDRAGIQPPAHPVRRHRREP